MFTIATIIMVCVIIFLSFMISKLLAILVGALLLYFCPIIGLFLILGGIAYYRFTKKGKAKAKYMIDNFSDREQ